MTRTPTGARSPRNISIRRKAGPHPMSDTITMFSTPWCGWCKRLKVQLEAEGIEFVEIDITRDPEAERFVVEVNNGNATVPTLHFADGSVLTNPTAAQVRTQLGRPQPEPRTSLR